MPAPAGRVAARQWASQRQRYLDILKVLLIAAIIVGHAVESYADLDWWSYGEVREVTLLPVTEVAVLVVAGPFALLLIPVLFLIAGLLSRPSLRRKGAGAYARGRLLREGCKFGDERLERVACASGPLVGRTQRGRGRARPRLAVWGRRPVFVDGEPGGASSSCPVELRRIGISQREEITRRAGIRG